MCDAKPGLRCASEAHEDWCEASETYAATYGPDATAVSAVDRAEATWAQNAEQVKMDRLNAAKVEFAATQDLALRYAKTAEVLEAEDALEEAGRLGALARAGRGDGHAALEAIHDAAARLAAVEDQVFTAAVDRATDAEAELDAAEDVFYKPASAEMDAARAGHTAAALAEREASSAHWAASAPLEVESCPEYKAVYDAGMRIINRAHEIYAATSIDPRWDGGPRDQQYEDAVRDQEDARTVFRHKEDAQKLVWAAAEKELAERNVVLRAAERRVEAASAALHATEDMINAPAHESAPIAA
jgi:hypothetical protein